MAQRPVFIPVKKAPFVDVFMPEFVWNGGFAVSQKQKNITALHRAFEQRFPERKVLEISSKSMQESGVQLSAFHLKKFVPTSGKSIPVECAFQGSKRFSAGGPYKDLYEASAKNAKGDPRLRQSGSLKSFIYEGKEFPLSPTTAFYDWLYINALLENPDLAQSILQYDAFTDIEFNPGKSLNCQAQSAAMFLSLSRLGLVEQCQDFDTFLRLLR